MDTDEPRPLGAFHSYTLHTTSVRDAARFYAGILNRPVATDDGVVRIAPLPDRARRRGAPSHWRGEIGVADPSEAASRLVSSGAVLLEPARPTADGPHALKDPSGAIVAVRTAERTEASSGVGWHLANVADLESAWRFYADAFEWSEIEDGDLPGGLGRFRVFGWAEGGPAVGMLAETADAPHIHPHWLFHFDVSDLDEAVGTVQASGGRMASEPMDAFGSRFAVCDDPQGAAVAFRQVLR